MTKRQLFQQLCDLADALEDECDRVDVSPHQLALEQVVERLDVLIDAVLEEGVQDNGGPPRRAGEGRWVLPPKPWGEHA